MNYTDITELALSYMDREDAEVTSRVDKFILLIESRINRKLKVSDMSARSVVDLTTTDPDQEYFQLPDDFSGLRDIQISHTGGGITTLNYLNPEQMNNFINSGAQIGFVTGSKIYYNIIARQIHVVPAQSSGFLEIAYYQQIPNLNATDPNNWISDEFPDIYIHGLCQEIAAFTKDSDAFGIWKARFDESLNELHVEDSENRWSGTPLEVKVG